MTDDDIGKLFRQLPDEDPPEGGMSALMAAARTKAAQMAATPPKRSLWARMVDLFKRPPVLAFATIVVLVGGAVIVKRHGSALEVAPVVATAPEVHAAAPVARDQEDVAPPALVPPSSPAAGSAVTTDRSAAVQHAVPARAAPTPAAKQGASAGDVMTVDDGATIARAVAPPPPPTPKPTPPAVAETPKLEPKAESRRPTAPPAGIAIATDEVVAAPAAVGPSAEQLLHECQSAATRGDCPAVRMIAGRIAKANAELYRSRVVKDAAIAKCLP